MSKKAAKRKTLAPRKSRSGRDDKGPVVGMVAVDVGGQFVPIARVRQKKPGDPGEAEYLDRVCGLPHGDDVVRLLEDEAQRLLERLAERRELLADDPDTLRSVEQWSTYRAVSHGFYLALVRYADDLKHVPEVAAIHKRLARGRKLGAAATKKKAAPRREEIRKRFRELRRRGCSVGEATTMIAQDMRISEMTVYRHRRGLT